MSSSPKPPVTVLENARVVAAGRVEAKTVTMRDGLFAGESSEPGTVRVDLREHLIVPGLINAHDHLALNCIPRLPHDRPFGNSYEWIAAYEEFRETPAVATAIALPQAVKAWHGGLKNVLAGVTTVVNHDPWHEAFDSPAFPVTVLRGVAWTHSIGLSDPLAGAEPKYGPRLHDSFAATPSTTRWVVHAAEGIDDVARSEVRQLDVLGCLAPNTVLVHGVGMSNDDVDLVIERGASVIWCPSSNLELFGRTLHPRRLFDAGRLALATDSRLTGARDLLRELRVAATHSDFTTTELFELVTSRPATMFGLPVSIGEPKTPADCLIVQDQGDPYRALVGASRADVRAVVRGGVPVIADPDFADWFTQCGIDVAAVRLDGRPKLLARSLARAELAALEPGLEIS